jgi:hypothetical protein
MYTIEKLMDCEPEEQNWVKKRCINDIKLNLKAYNETRPSAVIRIQAEKGKPLAIFYIGQFEYVTGASFSVLDKLNEFESKYAIQLAMPTVGFKGWFFEKYYTLKLKTMERELYALIESTASSKIFRRDGWPKRKIVGIKTLIAIIASFSSYYLLETSQIPHKWNSQDD